MVARSLVHGGTKSCGCAWQFKAGGKSRTKEYRATQEQRRVAKKRAAGGDFTHEQIEHLYELQRGRCTVCGASKSLRSMHRDHIVPVSAGGDSSIHNIQLLCQRCNLSKGSKDSIRFMQAKGYLL